MCINLFFYFFIFLFFLILLLFQTKHYLQTKYITFNIIYKSLTLQYSFTFTFLTDVREKKEKRRKFH